MSGGLVGLKLKYRLKITKSFACSKKIYRVAGVNDARRQFTAILNTA